MRLQKRRLRVWLLGSGMLLLASLVASARADIPVFTQAKAEQAKALVKPELHDFEIGWQGKYRVGNLAEVRFKLAAQEYFQGIVYLLVQDADGNEVRYGPILNSTGYHGAGALRYKRSILAPRSPFQVKIELRIIPLGDSEVDHQFYHYKNDFLSYPVDATWTRSGIPGDAIPSTRETLLELGPSLNLRNALALSVRDSNALPAIISVPNYHQDFLNYQGFSGIVLTSSIKPANHQVPAPGLDLYNVMDWVRNGGELLLVLHESGVAGPRGYQADEIWKKLLPGLLTEERVPHQQFSVWERFLGTDEPLVINEELRRNPPLIPVLSDLRGKVLLADGDTPLVIEHQLGLGRVVTCLVDLNAEPWRNWRKRDELLQRLIPWHLTTESETKFANSSSSLRLGYDDLAGQFVTAQGTFQTVKLTPFWILMGSALGFGLVWYFLQAVFLKTWSAASRLVMAAVVVTAASIGFFTMFGGFTQEEKLLANSAQVVDYNAMQGEYQGQAWISLLSSNSRQIDLRAENTKATAKKGIEEPTQSLEWLGLPGKGWGGLDAPLANWTQVSEPYQLESRSAVVKNLTLSPDLTKSFHERWHSPTQAVQTTPLVSNHGESLPRGTLKSELPFALYDAILLYDTWGVELGTIQPGQVIDLDLVRARVASAGTVITGKRAQPTAPVQSYNRASTDVREVLKLLLLHRAAGGTRYTGLFSRAWPLLDLSGTLTENQAMILGSGPAPVKWKIGPAGEKLEVLDAASEVCLYRLWLPVIPNEEATGNASGPTMIRLPK